jgi:hypothetical protein
VQVDLEDVPRDEIDMDIRNFLIARFQTLRYGKQLLEAHPDSIDTLAKKAEKLFIYARTVIEHLNHKVREVSLRRLAQILSGDAAVVGMPALDNLYRTILQNAFDDNAMNIQQVRARVRTVLAGLVLDGQVTAEVLAPLMGLSEDVVVTTVEELRSVLSCDGEDLRTAIIRPIHLTFTEFLEVEKRCANSAFYIDRRAWRLDFAKACLGTLKTILRRTPYGWNDKDYSRNRMEEKRSFVQELVPAHARYACENWTVYSVKIEQSSDPALLRVLDGFCRKKLLSWIEVQAYAGGLNKAYQMLWDAHSWAKVSVYSALRVRFI